MRALIIALMLTTNASPASRPDPDSVYEIDPSIDIPLIVAGATAVAIPYALASRLIELRCPCAGEDVRGIDRSVIGNRSELLYVLSTIEVGLAVAAPFALDYAELGMSRVWIEDAVVYAQTLALSASMVTLVKHLSPRPLPLLYDNPTSRLVRRSEGYRAFYSGHVANATAVFTAYTVTQSLRHGPNLALWIADLALMATVGAGVILSGRHFYSDVLVGGLAGLFAGTVVPALHRRDDRGPTFALVPVERGVMLSLTFSSL